MSRASQTQPGRMVPLPQADLSAVEAVFTDVDGTLTTGGRLTSATLAAVERLASAGVPVVLVSGRPSGWGEAWARQWPVAGVIVENGGLYFARRQGKLVKRYLQPAGVRARNRARLEAAVEALLVQVPGARRSMDSSATEVDLAIDYAEDAALGPAGADRIEAFLRARGITAVRSSVHVNCWVGKFDKQAAVARFLRDEWHTALRPGDGRYVYAGDSFNDEPMFAAFPLSVGVANVRDVLDRLQVPPRFVTAAREGRGFEELARAVLRARRSA